MAYQKYISKSFSSLAIDPTLSSQSQAVYGSKDELGRVHRRVSKETAYEKVVPLGTSRQETSRRQEHVLYRPEFEGLIEAEIKELLPVSTRVHNQ